MNKEEALELYNFMKEDWKKIQDNPYYPSIETIDLDCYDQKKKLYDIILTLRKYTTLTYAELKYMVENFVIRNCEIEINVELQEYEICAGIKNKRPIFKIIIS